MSKVISLGIHIVDVLGRPVERVPAGQGLALLKEIRMTVAGTAAGTAIDMPNYEESVICGFKAMDDLLRCFLDQGARHAVIRLGEGGSVIGWQENGVLQKLATPAFQVPVVDSTGCGDAYNAGFIKGLSLGWDLEQSARLGCACGGLCIQGLGSDAGIESFEQVLTFASRAKLKSTALNAC